MNELLNLILLKPAELIDSEFYQLPIVLISGKKFKVRAEYLRDMDANMNMDLSAFSYRNSNFIISLGGKVFYYDDYKGGSLGNGLMGEMEPGIYFFLEPLSINDVFEFNVIKRDFEIIVKDRYTDGNGYACQIGIHDVYNTFSRSQIEGTIVSGEFVIDVERIEFGIYNVYSRNLGLQTISITVAGITKQFELEFVDSE